MQTVSTFSKLMIGFVMGAVVAGGVAVAVTPDLPPTKVCVDNRSKALFAATDGSCSRTRTLMEIVGKGVDVQTIAAAVSPSVVSIAVSSVAGNGSGSGVIYRSNPTSSFIITNNHVISMLPSTQEILADRLLTQQVRWLELTPRLQLSVLAHRDPLVLDSRFQSIKQNALLMKSSRLENPPDHS